MGWAETAAAESRAFLWTPTEGLLDLSALLPLDAGWRLQRARSINDAGYIVGQGVNPAGEMRAFLLSPLAVPAPSSLLLLATGGLALRLVRSRRRVLGSGACRQGVS